MSTDTGPVELSGGRISPIFVPMTPLPQPWYRTLRGKLLIAAMIVVAIAIVVPITVVKTLKHRVFDQGMVAIDYRDGSSEITFYTTHGDAIQEWLHNGTSWSKVSEVILPNNKLPRKNTAIMAAYFKHQEELVWSIFYFDKKNYLRQMNRSNASESWTEGQLNGDNFLASSSETTGLSVCQMYGTNVGFRLFFGSEKNQSIVELTWHYGRQSWDWGHAFEGSDPKGGVECTQRSSSVLNVWLNEPSPTENEANLVQWWTDLGTASDINPVWHKGLRHGKIRGPSAVSAIEYNGTRSVITQDTEGYLQETVVQGNGNASKVANTFTVAKEKALPGAKVATLVLNSTVSGEAKPDFHVWYKSKDCGGIKEWVRAYTNDYWSCGSKVNNNGLTCNCQS